MVPYKKLSFAKQEHVEVNPQYARAIVQVLCIPASGGRCVCVCVKMLDDEFFERDMVICWYMCYGK